MLWTRSVKGSLAGLCVGLAAIAGACDDDKDADAAAHAADHAANGDHGAEPHSHNPDSIIGDLTGTDCPDDSTLTYDNFGKDFMTKYCTTCHSEQVKGAARGGAPDDHNFDTFAEIELLANHIDQYAGAGPDATNTKMPPADPKPTLEERQKLSEWLNCGPIQK